MQLLSARYKKWGGSIRWCLAQALDPGNEKLLEAGISATTLAALQAAVDPRKAANVSSLTVAATDHITVADSLALFPSIGAANCSRLIKWGLSRAT
jgi:hypothetical protein